MPMILRAMLYISYLSQSQSQALAYPLTEWMDEAHLVARVITGDENNCHKAPL